jgi:hypothetical protein
VAPCYHPQLQDLTGTHQLDDPPDLSCEDGTSRDATDNWEPTRNRKVAGSDATPAKK